MPRPRHLDPPVRWNIAIPRSVALRVELLLFDPSTGRPQYGARGDLCAQILSRWAHDIAQQITLNGAISMILPDPLPDPKTLDAATRMRYISSGRQTVIAMEKGEAPAEALSDGQLRWLVELLQVDRGASSTARSKAATPQATLDDI